jgi:hypothetical protein
MAPAAASVALTFSAGVDSFHSLAQLPRLGLSLGCLVNANAGAHARDRSLFALRVRRIRRIAAALGVPLLTIDGNLHEVLQIAHDRIHPLRNLSAVGLLRGVVEAVVYSSSYAYPMLDLTRVSTGIHYAGPMAGWSVAWSELPVVEVGHGVTRPEKSRQIAGMALARQHLDLCVDAAYQLAVGPDDPINCGECWKCVKALVTFDHVGVLDLFERVIPTGSYRADPDGFLARLDGRTGAGTVEIRELVARVRSERAERAEQAPDGRSPDGAWGVRP